MFPINILGEFVKFTRGTPEEFEALPHKNGNTLYFISEKNANTGKLYLGQKLIAGDSSTEMKLSDLKDVIIQQGIEVNSLLGWNGLAWVPTSIEDLIEELDLPVFTGATEEEDGTKGLVPAPTVEDKDKFLSSDGSWKTVESSSIEFTYDERTQTLTITTE